jgi:hypothetical protein
MTPDDVRGARLIAGGISQALATMGVNHNSREVRNVFTHVELFKLTPEGRENLTDVPKYLETIVTEEGSTTTS